MRAHVAQVAARREIWISCGFVSRVFLTEASILARKQSGEVHYVKSEIKRACVGSQETLTPNIGQRHRENTQRTTNV